MSQQVRPRLQKVEFRLILLRLVTLILLIPLYASTTAMAVELSFSQLDRFRNEESVLDSAWGEVQVSYLESAEITYLNLNVNGNWVVSNMPVTGFADPGTSQVFSTFFDLGIENGVDVTSLDYVSSITTAPLQSIPLGTPTTSPVATLRHQVGGSTPDEVPLTNKWEVAEPDKKEIEKKQRVRGYDKFPNQPIGWNECVPGSLSNSLTYLKNRKQIPKKKERIPGTKATDIDTVIDEVGTTTGGTPTKEWLKRKNKAYGKWVKSTDVKVTTKRKPLRKELVDDLIKFLKQGRDIEIQLDGHLVNLVGVIVKKDGCVILEVLSDSQTDNRPPKNKKKERGKADPIKRYKVINGTIEGRAIKGFIIEEPRKAPKQGKEIRGTKGRSRGRTTYEPSSQRLSFSDDFMTDTGFSGDTLVGSEVVLPEFELLEINLELGEVLFERVDDDALVMIRSSEGSFFEARNVMLSYDIENNEFFGTLFDITLADVDPNSPFFDANLASVNSPFLESIEGILDSESPDYWADGELYFTFTPDDNFKDATDLYTKAASTTGTNGFSVSEPVPEPTSLALLAFGGLMLARRRRHTW